MGRGARGSGASHPRKQNHARHPFLAGLLWLVPESLEGCKGSGSSSHGRDSGTFPLPPPLGLEGFAFHMAPEWGRWAQGSGCSCSRSGGPGEPTLRNPTSQRAGSSTSAGPWLERRRLRGEGHLLTHHISPLPASFSVSATGWRAGEGSEARYSRGAGGVRGGHRLPALLRRRRRLECGAAGRRQGWVGASKSLTKGN